MKKKKSERRRVSRRSKRLGRGVTDGGRGGRAVSPPDHMTEKEFVKSVWRTMKGQEKDPSVALLHERLEGTIRLIGLTGGIASGKSTVASFFRKAGIPLIDADEIARLVVKPKTAVYREIVASFGEGILSPNGEIDREKLGKIVFSDDAKKRLLESITHPEIFREILKQVRGHKKRKTRAVVVDVPLLFESGLDRFMHKNLLVRVHPDIQMKRLMARDKFSEVEAWQRILSQMPTPEKEKRADFVVDNSGSREETGQRVTGLIREII